MTEIASHTAQIESCEIHYLEAGSKEDQTVILLHGMKFQAATWQETGTLQQLAEAGYHAIAIDMPGFGKSPSCPVDQEKVIQGLISEKKQQVILVGPSMGGRIALEFAINNPVALNGLVLIGAVGVLENENSLSEINVRTLLVWGGADQISPLANCELLQSSITGAEKIIIDGAPHPCYLDNAEIWNRELIRFLKTTSN